MLSPHLDALAHQAGEAAEYAGMLARLTRDLPSYVRTPLTTAQARQRILAGLAHRERDFLRLVDRTVFGFARSPYRRLLAHAGCERGDLHALVAAEGLEGALRSLAAQGVYVRFDELKGRCPIVRGSTRFNVSDRDFDNPLLRHHLVTLTGGSRGRPSRVKRTLASITDVAATFALVLEAYGIRQPRNLFWRGGSLTWPLLHLKLGQPIDAWYYPIHPLPYPARAGIAALRLVARLAGQNLAAPEHCDVQDAERIARWLVDHADPGRPIVVASVVSAAVRVAAAAASLGRTLEGVTFHCRSEPISPARRRQLEAVRARVLPAYASIEISSLGYGCPNGTGADDLHFSSDRLAVIARARPIFAGGPEIDALLFTTMSRHAAKVALNVELGDSARIKERDCGCLLGSLGLRTHLSEVRSFEKLSSEGTTFARGNVLQILEEVLPGRFGGTAIDYQIVEEEATDGLTRLILNVHPRVGEADADAMRAMLLAELARGGLMDAYQAALLSRAAAIDVRRAPPLATAAGKVLPYHLLRHGPSGAPSR